MFKRMDYSPKTRRMHSLTADTSNALHQTLSGRVALIKYKLDVGFKYVLPGKDQSDRIEAISATFADSMVSFSCESHVAFIFIIISSPPWTKGEGFSFS